MLTDTNNECPMWFTKLPARLTSEEVGRVLGFSKRDIIQLTSVGLLTPLGKPTQQMVKHYSAKRIAQLADDEKWLHKATLAVQSVRIEQEQLKAA